MSFEKDWCMRNVHIAAIKQMSIDIDTNIDSYAYFSLDERVKKVQSDMHKFESKNLAIMCNEKGTDFNEIEFNDENLAIVNLVMDLKAKIREKMAKLGEPNTMPNVEVNTGKNEMELNTEGVQEGVQAISIQNEQAIQKATSIQNEQANHEENKKQLMATIKFSVPDWHTFESEFNEKVIGNDKFSNEEKFILLLKACAASEAEHILARLSKKDVVVAFEALKRKFGTAYTQVNFFTETLFNIPILEEKIPSYYISLVHSVDWCVAGLKRHLDVDKFVHLIPAIVINKLHGEVRVNWERYRSILAKSCEQGDSTGKPIDYVPDWETVKLFLQDEADFQAQFGDSSKIKMSTTGDSEDKTTATSAKMQFTETTSAQALSFESRYRQGYPNMFCECSFWHPIHKCAKFMALNLNDRKQYIQDRKICSQCLLLAHMGTPCKDPKANEFCKRCDACGEKVKHNSMLCIVSYRKANNLAIVLPNQNNASVQQQQQTGDSWDDDWGN